MLDLLHQVTEIRIDCGKMAPLTEEGLPLLELHNWTMICHMKV